MKTGENALLALEIPAAMSNVLTVDFSKNPQLSVLESDILTQYQGLATRLKTLAQEIQILTDTKAETAEAGKTSTSAGAADALLQNLRDLEMKIGLVHTLFKAAVYSLFMATRGDHNQQDVDLEEEDDHEDVSADE